MKIATSDLAFSTQHLDFEETTVQESSQSWVRKGDQVKILSESFARSSSTRVSLSSEGQALNLEKNPATQADPAAQAELPSLASGMRTASTSGLIDEAKKLGDLRLDMMRLAVEILTGRKINVFDVELRDPADAQSEGFGAEYQRSETHAEYEQSDFSAEGRVITADGREINFQLSLSMSHSYYSETNTSLRMGVLKDPLVLNFSGTAAALADARFSFDLDSDGADERLRTLAPGSAFLVFDRNGDGKVNNGSELFGARSGDGFGELAALDDDGNGWIDENDSVWQQLYVWSGQRDDAGNDILRSLKDAKVGAIALKNAATPFALKDLNNQLLAQIRSTGVFLTEGGMAGTVQKIDLVV
ncbi:hypothetical protein AGMMS50225_08450 [Betaproteobacteria bacterium]|nr:hypothetical protein AGMMS50225_08450 [Betaproteobacteria bacterium]